tara:strand:- start:259 stop:468 length:210 start_codon:yes stop_codon:yes gene_type:complete
MSKVLLSQEDWIFLYSELASYVEEKLVGDDIHRIRNSRGQRFVKYDEQFCTICSDVEEIMGKVFEKEES